MKRESQYERLIEQALRTLCSGYFALYAGRGGGDVTKGDRLGPERRRHGITREFRFKNYYQTIAFVNALAWVAHSEDHHPFLEVHYNRCNVHFSTHSIGGLSENDFICAAKLDMLISGDS